VDPDRLLDSPADEAGAVDSLERELLGALRPSSQARQQVWQGVATRVGIAAGAAGAVGIAASKASAAAGAAAGQAAGSSTAAAGATSAAATTTTAAGVTSTLTAKVGLALLVAAPIGGAAAYMSYSEPAPRVHTPVTATIQTAAPRPTVKPRAAEPEALAPQAEEPEPDPPKQTRSKVVVDTSSQLAEENQLLREARSAARAGNAAVALSTLQKLDQRFPRGALLQERELLRVQTLETLGRHTEARARAITFVRRYPKSPYSKHLSKLTAPDSP